MGHWSELQIAMTEGGMDLWEAAKRNVCAACFEDPALQDLVKAEAHADQCDYCGETSETGAPIAASLDAVVRHIGLCIAQEWVNADGELPYDKEVGDYILGGTVDTDELVYEIDLELPRDDDDALRQDISNALPQVAWCRENPLIARPHEAIANSWRSFCHVIKHERRFYFLQYETPQLQADIDQEEAAYTIPELLDVIAAYAARTGLYVTAPAGIRHVRGQERANPAAAPFGPRRMGPAPYDKALQPNRMSPAGVPMFYGAEDDRTALMEITRSAGDFALGVFQSSRPLQLLDLRKAPAVPSLFDLAQAKDRPFALFMREFIADFQKPVETGAEVEYVPTQVVTEYFRSVARHDDRPIDGVLYASTRNPGGTAVVLFATEHDVEDPAADPVRDAPKPWLQMVSYQQVTFDPAA